MSGTVHQAQRAATQDPAPTVDLGDVQALLRSALRTLPDARLALFHLPVGSDGRMLLRMLADLVTTAAARDAAIATQVAITPSGLAAPGLPELIMNEFGDEFRSGMNAPIRSRFLGDTPG